MTDPRVERARTFLLETNLLEKFGLGEAAGKARMLARDVVDLVDELESARTGEAAMRDRHELYVAYHAHHCFNRDGTTTSGVVAPAFDAVQPDEVAGV